MMNGNKIIVQTCGKQVSTNNTQCNDEFREIVKQNVLSNFFLSKQYQSNLKIKKIKINEN